MKAPKIQKDTLRKVLRYIRPYWALVGISILLAAVTVADSLSMPILIGGGGSVAVGAAPQQQPDHLTGGA